MPVFQNAEQKQSGNIKAFGLILMSHLKNPENVIQEHAVNQHVFIESGLCGRS